MSYDKIASIRFWVFIGGLVLFLLVELINPYRPNTVSKLKRWLNNMGITIFNSLILKLLFASTLVQTCLYVTDKQLGVMNLTAVPYWVKTLVTIIVMDFMLYVWHLLNHEMPFLWRFHRVHHTDLNMDVSTATRFHIGELAVSAVIKISLVFFLGADLFGLVKPGFAEACFEELHDLASLFLVDFLQGKALALARDEVPVGALLVAVVKEGLLELGLAEDAEKALRRLFDA